MITEAYSYIAIENKTVFVFHSEGSQGTIVKVVEFTLTDEKTWNLGFGDWSNGDIDDTIVTNNHDAMRVIRTVAKATIEFLEEYPKRVITIQAVDEKRNKLYNLVFQRHFKEIEPIFDVFGLIKGKKESYSTQKYYERFELKLK
jgi:protein tyrosine phosphatase